MSVTVRTKGSNSSKIVLEFYIQFEYIVYIVNLYVGFPFFYACSFICASSGSFVPYMDRQIFFF